MWQISTFKTNTDFDQGPMENLEALLRSLPTIATTRRFGRQPPKLKDRPQYSVSQQYPVEISDRRKQLYPKMRELQRQGRRANIVYDILIVDGRPYDPPPRRGPQDARAGR